MVKKKQTVCSPSEVPEASVHELLMPLVPAKDRGLGQRVPRIETKAQSAPVPGVAATWAVRGLLRTVVSDCSAEGRPEETTHIPGPCWVLHDPLGSGRSPCDRRLQESPRWAGMMPRSPHRGLAGRPSQPLSSHPCGPTLATNTSASTLLFTTEEKDQ